MAIDRKGTNKHDAESLTRNRDFGWRIRKILNEEKDERSEREKRISEAGMLTYAEFLQRLHEYPTEEDIRREMIEKVKKSVEKKGV